MKPAELDHLARRGFAVCNVVRPPGMDRTMALKNQPPLEAGSGASAGLSIT